MVEEPAVQYRETVDEDDVLEILSEEDMLDHEEALKKAELSADFLHLDAYAMLSLYLCYRSKDVGNPRNIPVAEEEVNPRTPKKITSLPPWATSHYNGKWA